MEIHGPGPVGGAQPVRSIQQLKSAQTEAVQGNEMPVDCVDISPDIDFVQQVHDLPDMRTDRIAEVRAEIDAGIYETDEKLDIAVGRLLDEIG